MKMERERKVFLGAFDPLILKWHISSSCLSFPFLSLFVLFALSSPLNSNSTIKRIRSIGEVLSVHHQNRDYWSVNPINQIKSSERKERKEKKKKKRESTKRGTTTISNMSSSSTSFSPDQQHLTPSDKLCYVHCNFCDTVLAVSSSSSSITHLFTFFPSYNATTLIIKSWIIYFTS